MVCESSGAPWAVAVTVKLNGESSVAEVDVRLTIKAGCPGEPGETSPGASVMVVWLSEPFTPAGSAAEAQAVRCRLVTVVLQHEPVGCRNLGPADCTVGEERELEAMSGQVGERLAERSQIVSERRDCRLHSGRGRGVRKGCAIGPKRCGERGEGRFGGELADHGTEGCLSLTGVDRTGWILDEIRECCAEIAQAGGEDRIAKLVGRHGRSGDGGRAGTTTLTGTVVDWVSGELCGPKVAVSVASRMVLSGVELLGVRLMFSVVDCPARATPGPIR